MSFLVAFIVGFAVVAGITGLVWLRNGRDPRSPDDPSLLAAAPPAGMTAATATLVAGGSTHDAFVAALLDLASRDEIGFESEGVERGADRVGIAIHGGESDDARVLLNRRLPIGEAESWLLAQLKLAVTGRDAVDPSVAMTRDLLAKVVGGAQLAATLTRVQAATAEGDDSPEARAAREHGLDAVAAVDPDDLAAAVEREAGKGLSMEDRERPADEAPHAKKQRHSREDYISARRALTLGEPLFFGTLLGTYAKRHGWTAGVTGIRRLKWRLIGIGEVVAGVVLSVVATNLFSDVLIGLALGVGIAGAVTYMTAGAMAARTREGAMARTQLAAYARTLRATFSAAGSMDDVVGSGNLRWLETADQALVWGMALGLRAEIEALLSRTTATLGTAGADTRAYLPSWFTRHRTRGSGSSPSGDPSSMFAGIERIGSEAPSGGIPGMRGGHPGVI